MAGYRDTSNYEPFGTQSGGRPMRPFNWVQWIGMALVLVSVASNLAFLAGEAGWLPKWGVGPSVAFGPLFLGMVLVNSRRQPIPDLAPELAGARRRWMIVVVTICAVVLGVATVLTFQGA
jgi:hypothetical protein